MDRYEAVLSLKPASGRAFREMRVRFASGEEFDDYVDMMLFRNVWLDDVLYTVNDIKLREGG